MSFTARKADEHDALLLGVRLVFIGTIASRYYGTIVLLLLLLGFGDGSTERSEALPPARRFAFLTIDSAVFLLISAVWAWETAGANNYTEYFFANLVLFLWFFALLGFRVFGAKLSSCRAIVD